MISPLAYIHPEAQIGENVEIAPFVFIDKNVVIGDNNKIMANANILYGARIGNGNTIFPGDDYELFYYQYPEGWISLGMQTAEKEELIYTNVPAGSLYWLRNLSTGKEERIFVKKGNNIVFL